MVDLGQGLFTSRNEVRSYFVKNVGPSFHLSVVYCKEFSWLEMGPPLSETVNCIKLSDVLVKCNGTEFSVHEEPLSYKDSMFWVYLGVYVALVLVAGKILRGIY